MNWLSGDGLFEVLKLILSDFKNKADKNVVVSGIKGEAETIYRTGNVNITKENIGVYKKIGVFAGGEYSTIGLVKDAVKIWCIQPEALTTIAQFIAPTSLADCWTDTTHDDDPVTDELCVYYITPLGGYHAADGTVARGEYMISSYYQDFVGKYLDIRSPLDEGLHPEWEGYTLNEDGTYSITEEV